MVCPIRTREMSAPYKEDPMTHRTPRTLSRLLDWLRRVHCGLLGHDMMMRFEPARLLLRCHGCGEETPGWSIR
jgi:hypothetical protein